MYMSPWLILSIAGLLEVVWVLTMKASKGFTHVGWSIATAGTAWISFWLLGLAMKDLPVGTAYSVWVGIGAVGAAIFGIIWFSDPTTPARIAGIALIVAGVSLLKFAT